MDHLCLCVFLRHGSRTALHLPFQEVEEEKEISSSRRPQAYLPSCQVRYHNNRLCSFSLLSCQPLEKTYKVYGAVCNDDLFYERLFSFGCILI